MPSLMRTLLLATLLAAVAALPLAALAAAAPSRTLVCVTAPTGSLAGPATPVVQPPLSLGTIRSTTGTGGPATTLPGVVLLTPQPQTGAYVVPTQTTMPSLPGVTLTTPQLLVPPLPAPGQNRPLIASGLLQSAVGPFGAAPICY